MGRRAAGDEALDAVNTVVFEDGRATGHNTDATGFSSSFARAPAARRPGRSGRLRG
jgi:shikimate 5-dehydrogenase